MELPLVIIFTGLLVACVYGFVTSANRALWRPVLAAILAGLTTAFFSLAATVDLSCLVITVLGFGGLFYVQGWLSIDRKTRLSFRRRTFLMGLIYVVIAGDVVSAWYGYAYIDRPGPRSRVARARSEIRNLAVNLETYYIDHKVYPPAVDANGRIVPLAADGSAVSSGYVSWVLTTPVAYAATLPSDSFWDPKKKTAGPPGYRYATNGLSCWIMTSKGPDKDDDIKVEEYPVPTKGNCSWRQFMSQFGVGNAIEYDASNGTTSSGDVVRVGP